MRSRNFGKAVVLLSFLLLVSFCAAFAEGKPALTLDPAELTLEKGKLIVVLGPSGAGKSTLLNLLGGLDSPTEGTIRVDGQDISRLNGDQLAEYRARGGDWPAFFTLWTRKEAWCKYTGEGLARSLRQTPPKKGLFYGFYAGEGWRAAVCGEEPAPKEILWLGREALP